VASRWNPLYYEPVVQVIEHFASPVPASAYFSVGKEKDKKKDVLY